MQLHLIPLHSYCYIYQDDVCIRTSQLIDKDKQAVTKPSVDRLALKVSNQRKKNRQHTKGKDASASKVTPYYVLNSKPNCTD